MKTRSQIVGELLKDGKITSEEAVVLLTPEYVNNYPIWNPPFVPYYQTSPYVITCGTGTLSCGIGYANSTNN